ncbi:MAG TPA: right-handed parallel beta-helix repeat-containing protein [Bryobacteraceae bacterium]|nr:right-handed parallel beta-helix repeat-containing protein [Bryobacteraceae bacterium]
MLSTLLLTAAIFITPEAGIPALEKARDQVRASAKPGTIIIRRGDYFVDHPIELNGRDPAGTLYLAEPGVRFIGGVRLRDWKPVEDAAILARLGPEARKNVRVHTVANLGGLQARGFSRDRKPAHSELFFAGDRMTVARWPNGDEFTRIASWADPEAPDDGHGQNLGRLPYGFRYAGDRPSLWKPDQNIWVHGYWAWDWADSYDRIASLDTKTRTIVTAPPHGLYGFRKNQRYYFLNVLEELDAPGEYYLDVAAGRVYFWPPSDVAKAEVFLSKLDAPVFRVRGAKELTLDGFAVEAARGNGLEIADSTGIRVRNARLRNIGNVGIVVEGGKRNIVQGCSIAFTGDSAIEVSGGDRATLTPGEHQVTDCDIHHMGQWVRTYNPAVKLSGVGHRVAHNHIHDAPHAGILMTGNDHIVEFNNMHHLAMETGDVGAVYIGRDYTERGTQIRYNYIHELGGIGLGSMAVYLDDCASGITVYGNVFHKLKYGAFIGGGRDNRVENNVFISANPAVHVDARGIDPKPVWHNMVYKLMRPKVPDGGIYFERYPELRAVLPYFQVDTGVPPEGNLIRRNLIYGPGIAIRKPALPYVPTPVDNTTLPDDSGFDPATGAYRTPPGAPHTPIPVERIGPTGAWRSK